MSAAAGVKDLEPIVVLGDDWGRHVSTTQHLIKHIGIRHPIVWVNSYGHRTPKFNRYDMARALSKGWRMLRSARPGGAARQKQSDEPDEIIDPKALPWHGIAAIHRFNTSSVLRDIQRALRRINSDKSPIFVCSGPLGCDLVGRLGESVSIYLCIDDYNELPGVQRNLLVPFEHRLVARVDGTVVTARSLLDGRVPKSGLGLHLPQGVNFEHFANPRSAPAELLDLPRPIIGFAGGVGSVIDWDLMRHVALTFPAATVLFVGMLQEGFDPKGLPENMLFLGARPYADLPAYVQQFDVALVPYVLNRHTIAVDPLKLLEYLAAGLPVVCTDLPEAEKYRDFVSIAANTNEFIDAISAELATNDAEKATGRSESARCHTWASRADEFLSFVEHVRSSV